MLLDGCTLDEKKPVKKLDFKSEFIHYSCFVANTRNHNTKTKVKKIFHLSLTMCFATTTQNMGLRNNGGACILWFVFLVYLPVSISFPWVPDPPLASPVLWNWSYRLSMMKVRGVPATAEWPLQRKFLGFWDWHWGLRIGDFSEKLKYCYILMASFDPDLIFIFLRETFFLTNLGNKGLFQIILSSNGYPKKMILFQLSRS